MEHFLERYENAIANLESSPSLQQGLEVLTLRDAVQKDLVKYTLSASSLCKLRQLDQRLRQQQPWLEQNLDLADWRKIVKPSDDAWWWFSQPRSPVWWEQFDWLGTFLTLIFLTASASLTVDIFTRFLSGGLDVFSASTIITPGLLALLTSGALTSIGQKARQTLFTSFNLPKQYWQGVSTILALVVLLVLVAFYQLGLPRIGVYFNERGEDNYITNRLDSALSNLQRAIALRPNYAEAHYNLGLLYEDLHKFDQARTEYQLAVENSAELNTLTSLKAQNNLGRLYLLEENYADAIPPLSQGMNAIDEETVAASTEFQQLKYALLKNLGWAKLGQKHTVAATAILNEAIALNAEQAPAYCLLAQVYEEQQETAAAEESWEKCLQYVDIRKPEEYQWRSLALEAMFKGEQ